MNVFDLTDRFLEILDESRAAPSPQRPKSPEDARIEALRRREKQARTDLRRERVRKRLNRAKEDLSKINASGPGA